MEAGDLLHARVYSSDGEKIGGVFELIAEKSGPTVTEIQGKALVVGELLVGSSAAFLRLGYKSRTMNGPHGLRFLLKRLNGYRVPWDEIDSIEDRVIRLRCVKDDLAEI